MNKILFLLSLFIFVSTKVFAKTVPVSYITLGKTTATSTIVSVHELIDTKTYLCDTSSLLCTPTSTSSELFKELKTEEISFEKAEEMYIQENSEATAYKEKGITLPIDTIPNNARFITPNPQMETYAFYTTTGTYGIKDTRTFWTMNQTTGKTLHYTEHVESKLDSLSESSNLFFWNASGTTLVYLSDRNGYQQMYKVQIEKKATKSLKGIPLLTKKYTVLDCVIVGDTVYFIANRESDFTYNLYKLALTDGASVVKLVSDVLYTNNLVTSDKKIIFTKNEQGVGVLYAFNTENNSVLPFTGLLHNNVLVSTSTTISKTFLGRYHKGNNDKAVIWLHGGPYRQSADMRHSWGSYAMYDWMLEEAHKSGVSILKLDYPGSSGYGRNYTNRLVEKIGVEDVISLKRAITFLKQKGYSQIYLFGVSYGGYLTLKGAVDIPQDITEGLAIAPVTDWEVLIDGYSPTPFQLYFNTKNKRTSLYQKANITNKLSPITPPLTLIQGNNDSMVPFSQSLYFMTEAKKKGVSKEKIKLFSFDGEDHVFKNPNSVKSICEKFKEMIGQEMMSCTLEKE